MSLSARADDRDGATIGEAYITLSTSAGNALIFKDPSSANKYRIDNPSQFNQSSHGEFNTVDQKPSY